MRFLDDPQLRARHACGACKGALGLGIEHVEAPLFVCFVEVAIGSRHEPLCALRSLDLHAAIRK